MLAILGSLLGLTGSAIPSLMKYFQDKQDKKQELAILTLQLQMQEKQIGEQLQAINMQTNAAQDAAIYKTYNTGISWVDALNGSVRPMISYAFFLLYAGIKISQIVVMDEISLAHHTDVIWTQNDQIVFAGIVSFYFGSRAFDK